MARLETRESYDTILRDTHDAAAILYNSLWKTFIGIALHSSVLRTDRRDNSEDSAN